jgi:hypothetical protein
VVHHNICDGGSSDYKPNHNKDCNFGATNTETKAGE